MKILNVDFNESLEWSEDAALKILEKANPQKSKSELKKLIKTSGLCKTVTKSKKRESSSDADAGDANNV